MLFFLGSFSISALGQTPKPKPEFTLFVESNSSIVEAGQPVVVVVSRKNITEKTIEDGRTTNPMEYITFEILRDGIPVDEKEVLQRMLGKIPGEERTLVSSSFVSNLKPGESSHDTAELSFYYDMSKPGIYSITASQETHPAFPDKSVTVKSNTMSITILPVDEKPAAQR